MSISFYKNRGNLKGILFILGVLLMITGIWYSQRLVKSLEIKSTENISFRIKVFETNINNPDLNVDVDFLFNEVIKGADYPIIYTDTEHKPQSWINISARLDSTAYNNLSHADSITLHRQLALMAQENSPIPITYQNSILLGYYYYGYSPVIYKLRAFPYVAIGVAILFILIGYLGFSYIKKSEQQYIWVGMAKETAHQLGTPLSSIAGWVELLSLNPETRENSLLEVKHDLNRLFKIANRFSKIGSTPELKPHPLFQTVDNVVVYFRKRLPNMKKRIIITTQIDPAILINMNEELFEWVLENIIKNAIDAIEHDNGLIEIKAFRISNKDLVSIDICDNGKGIASHQKKNIFKPGISTKHRGWGLGLTLAKRIIEQYHGGKIFLKESRPNSGSTFRILMRSDM
jgi:hypothetical protein